jgi:hypothetical protein
VGYQRGEQTRDGVWHVSNHDAHAWPEVWLGEQIGWYSFEPTPGRANPSNNRGSDDTTPTSEPQTTPTTGSSTASSTPAPTGFGNLNPEQVEVPGQTSTGGTGDDTMRRVLATLLAIVGLAIVGALVALVTAVVRAILRTHRRRHHRDTRHRVLGAWAEALERMAAAGVEPRPSATPVEFALRHAPAHGAGTAGPPLMELARLQTSAMFAPDPPTDEQADDAWEHVDTIDRSVRASAPWFTRWRYRLRPSPTPAATREKSDHDAVRV